MSKTHPPLQSFLEKMAEEKEVHQVTIDLEPGILKYLGEQKYYSGFVKQEQVGEYVRMSFLTGSLMGFARWFMLFGDHAKIIEPAELNTLVTAIAENILKKQEQSQILLT